MTLRINRFDYFLDTSALIAMKDRRDQYHQTIMSFLNSSRPFTCLLSNLVLAEFYTHFAHYGCLKQILTEDKIFFGGPIQTVWIEQKFHPKILKTLQKFSDQKISYTDASSFVIMEEKKIKAALTFDDDFIKAGFEKVP